jgi:hypothetical protein
VGGRIAELCVALLHLILARRRRARPRRQGRPAGWATINRAAGPPLARVGRGARLPHKQAARELAAGLIPKRDDPMRSNAARDILVVCVASLQATTLGLKGAKI